MLMHFQWRRQVFIRGLCEKQLSSVFGEINFSDDRNKFQCFFCSFINTVKYN